MISVFLYIHTCTVTVSARSPRMRASPLSQCAGARLAPVHGARGCVQRGDWARADDHLPFHLCSLNCTYRIIQQLAQPRRQHGKRPAAFSRLPLIGKIYSCDRDHRASGLITPPPVYLPSGLTGISINIIFLIVRILLHGHGPTPHTPHARHH